jgi:hypothetical protein
MKAQILKIAGVKSEKEFYKKYPSEEAFMKQHGKAFKKAQLGTYIGGDSIKAPKPINYQDYYDDVDKQLTGTTEKERLDIAAKQASIAAASKPSGGGLDISSIMGMLGGEGGGEGAGGLMSMLGGAKYGTRIPKAQFGNDIEGPLSSTPGFVEGMGMDSVNGYGIDNSGNATNSYSAPKKPFDFAKGASLLGPVGGAINAFGEQRKQKNAAKQSMLLSGLSLDLSRMRPEQKERKYVTPWDNPVQPEQMFPTYGVGTNVLTGRNGIRLQSGGEIQNTYAPNNLYDDLEYEPLNNSNVKQYGVGGAVAGNMAGNFIGSEFNNNAGYQTGSAIGGFSDFILPGSSAFVSPILGAIGGGLDQAFGDAGKISRYQQNTKRNVENTVMNNMAPSIQASYSSNLKNGGYMNPEYNPQVIARFGELDAQDFAEFAHKDQYRAGGHLKSYTPLSERAMQTYEDGGNVNNYELGGVEVESGGYLEPISYNPYNDGTGITSMIRGQSHDEYDSKLGHSGVILNAYGNQVEAERGEPIREMEEGGSLGNDKSAVITGNLVYKNINNIMDPKYKKYEGKKIKNIHKEIALRDQRLNKLEEKNTNKLLDYEPTTAQDKLYGASLEANKIGYEMQYKNNAIDANYFTEHQSIINDTAEEYGLVADDLAKGKVKFDKEAMTTREAKWGDAIRKAADGATTSTETTKKPTEYKSVKELEDAGFKKNAKGEWYKPVEGKKKTSTDKKSASAMDNIPIQKVDKTTGLGEITPEQFEAFKKKNDWYTGWANFDPKNQNDVDKYAKAFNAEAEKRGSKARIMSDEIDPKTKKPIPGGKTKYVGKQFISGVLEDVKEETPGDETQEYAVLNEPNTKPIPYKRSALIDLGNQVLDYIRPSDQEPFDYGQTMGEMYALSSNQLEPVQAQLYNPELGVPYDISLQDQLNANQADFNSLQRLYANNPFALAQLNAQKYAANEKVLGEQFRANQAMKDKVYGDNRNILNQAKLTNLGILDKQYERQSEALSNTKATTQAALNSLADKMAKHKLENKTLGIYENLYKYRYDDKGRAINMNGIFQANIPTVGGINATQKQVPVLDQNGNVVSYKLQNKTPEELAAEQQQEEYTAVPSLATLPINGNTQTKTKKTSRNGSIVKAIKNL